MAIEQIPGVGPQNEDIADAVVAAGTSAGFAATGPTTSQIAAALPTNSTIASAVAAAVPTNANIQNIVTTYGNLSGGLDFRTMTAQQTFNTSSNNVTVSGRNWVYALIAGGGCGGGSIISTSNSTVAGPAGGVTFGMVPVSPVAIVGAGGNGANSVKGNDGGFTMYSGLRANGGSRYNTLANSTGTFPGFHNMYNVTIQTVGVSGFPGFAGPVGWPGQYSDANSAIGNQGDESYRMPFYQGAFMSFMNQQFPSGWGGTANDFDGGSGGAGGGGCAKRANYGAPQTGGNGGRSMLFAGGVGGTNNVTGSGAGAGGGGGISGAGGNGANVNGNNAGIGGDGGNGGGGGGAGGHSSNSNTYARGGNGGTGAVILYY